MNSTSDAIKEKNGLEKLEINVLKTIQGILKKIKCMAYSSQGTTPVSETSATAWYMVVRQNNMISNALCQMYSC